MGRGGKHLPQLFDHAGCPALGRVAEFLGLGGERAGPAGTKMTIDHASDTSGHGEPKSRPIDRRVSIRLTGREQIFVFDKGEAFDDQGRNCRKIGKGPLGIVSPVKRRAIAVEQLKPGPLFFVINRVTALVDKIYEGLRPACLPGNGKMMIFERVNKTRQLGVAEALVIGSVLRENDCLARIPRCDLKGHVAV